MRYRRSIRSMSPLAAVLLILAGSGPACRDVCAFAPPASPRAAVVRHLPRTRAIAARSPAAAARMASSSSSTSTARLNGVISNTLSHITHGGGHAHHKTTTIAGRLVPLLQKFRMGAHEFKEIGAAIVSVTDWQDILLLSFLAFLSPAFAQYRNRLQNNAGLQRFGVIKVVSDVSKVALAVYVVDIAMVILTTMGFSFPRTWKVSAVVTKVAYSAWALREFLYYKCRFLCRFYKVKDHNNMGRVEILDRFINGIAVFVYGLFLVDWLSLELGYALKSIFGLASVFSVAFTLASKDILSNLLAGIWLQASGKAVPGDAVKFGDGGISGGLIKLGWLETSLRDGEGAVVKVPNSELAGKRMSNLSHVKKSQVKQTLRFDYADADKIPELIHEVKEEIMKSCKKLVVDGSRPFRVHFSNYMEDHLEVTVVTHHNISPVTGEYHDNRQDLLLAINRAVKKCGMRFAQMVKVEIPGRETSWRVVPASAYLESERSKKEE